MSAVPSDAPPPTNRWADRDPDAAARLAAARAVIGELSERHVLPVENLLTPDLVRRLAWQPPDEPGGVAVAAALVAGGARRWQVDLAAEPLAAALIARAPEPDAAPGAAPAAGRANRAGRPVRDPQATADSPAAG
jgi:ribonuclease D